MVIRKVVEGGTDTENAEQHTTVGETLPAGVGVLVIRNVDNVPKAAMK